MMQGVRIVRVSLDRPSREVAALYEHLDPAERARAALFRGDVDRRRFVVARGTLRALLGEITGTSSASVPLRVLPGGKPVLCETSSAKSPLHFNLSHSRDVALFAFADREVGIDVERVDLSSDMSRVVANFFAPEECRVYRKLEGAERSRYFFRTWVRKEAYVKAIGKGFALDPSRVIVAETPTDRVMLLGEEGVPRPDDAYSVHDLTAFDDCVAAIALKRDSRAKRPSSRKTPSVV